MNFFSKILGIQLNTHAYMWGPPLIKPIILFG
jgi:hypothetical protein